MNTVEEVVEHLEGYIAFVNRMYEDPTDEAEELHYYAQCCALEQLLSEITGDE
jgi:hypothetical protein